jgi:hypothetical protein
MVDALFQIGELQQQATLQSINATTALTNLEIVRRGAATGRKRELSDLPSALFHESRQLSGNYLFGLNNGPLSDASYRTGEFKIPDGALIFTCGMFQATKAISTPAVVFLSKNSEAVNPTLILYVPDAPIAAMEVSLFDGEASAFEQCMFNDACEFHIRKREEVGKNLRSCGYTKFQPFLFANYFLERSGVLPFLRLRSHTTKHERGLVNGLVKRLVVDSTFQLWKGSLPEIEWLEQTRKRRGFELKSVFESCDEPSEPLEDDGGHLQERFAAVSKGIITVASIIVMGALDLPQFDTEKHAFSKSSVPDREFQAQMKTLCEATDLDDFDEDYSAIATQTDFKTLNNLSRFTQRAVATKILGYVRDKNIIKSFLGQYSSSSSHLVDISDGDDLYESLRCDLARLLPDRNALLLFTKFDDDGIVQNIRLMTNNQVRFLSMDAALRLLFFPWVFPLVVESGIVTTVEINGLERDSVTLTGYESATNELTTPVLEALHCLPELIKQLKDKKVDGTTVDDTRKRTAEEASVDEETELFLHGLSRLKRALQRLETATNKKKKAV